ncbi:NADH:flavin oxidoreductase/NADH oxidase [Chryseobacterium sp. SN22]|uniref:NADH:flavin oxidoreductase/NADH oxidase n=1 Tax=Chryseobacterium sp. SN22 TaxID=2606431 RepID=UPI002938E32E|nr:NADH:flavin oxidoreductase/NADH oxidase [Chryseobacterium sp. SN22]
MKDHNILPKLFTPFKLKDIELRNRIAVPPMCQYTATDGNPNDWHIIHYAQLARGGAGLVIVEATAVSPEGRITPGCLGIWNDEQMANHKNIAQAIKKAGAVPGIQIAHAGRKASSNIPWEGDDHIPDGDAKSWQTIAPSAIPFGGSLPKIPKEMSIDDIQRVKADFTNGAQRSLKAGYEWLELHFAHGYLAQSYFSSHSNTRTDAYGGDAKRRSRFLLEILQAVRDVWPDHLPLTARFGVLEFDGNDEQTMKEAIELIKEFKIIGLDLLNVSIGFTIAETNIPWGPAFMAPVAKRIRKETGLPVASAWGFGKPDLAENAVRNENLDLVMIGHAHLANPHWTYHAAVKLGLPKPSWVMPTSYAYWLERYKS